jgi:hypothetical protein
VHHRDLLVDEHDRELTGPAPEVGPGAGGDHRRSLRMRWPG